MVLPLVAGVVVQTYAVAVVGYLDVWDNGPSWSATACSDQVMRDYRKFGVKSMQDDLGYRCFQVI